MMAKTTVNDLAYYIPDAIPPEVQAYGSKLDQLGVGNPGKLGGLILRLEKDEHNGKTSVKEQYSRVPLYTGRALYLEEALPSMAYLYIISPSGGILQGDRYRMDITLRNNALAHITTQGATRIYRMEKNFATQIVNVDVGEGCYFEYIPDQIIPYVDSRFYQVANLRVHDSATMLYSEIMTPGRVARGESFAYDICYMKTQATNQDGDMRFVDVAIMEPKKRSMKAFGVLDNYDTVGSTYVLAPSKYVAELHDKINSGLAGYSKDLYFGASILPNNSGVIVRMLGDTASLLRNAVFEVVRAARKTILHAPFSGIRKA
ncbi:urease accessory protein UreH [Candidatus Nitrososphaera evergladensis SR1]|jgi:urease accessory protein|uniref:Urease accessory protein UreD n=1 Tax=Candidatus Nitrososphaera evergladensis SR1 TaxID=1459636 RepID=A0A075MW95_9ARCH|nr:urease accessory protein UreD [Candidatus Nitrososphaera evergladensis]AIF84922.1 urease accessory protein UreH [Candidatus Nitrososphaera evergladensis SR1]